jgi:hypothetical protein
MPDAALTILGSRIVSFTRGYAGVQRSQVTRIQYGPAIGYVRESVKASGMDHFCMSSGARLGHKARADVIGREVLELAAPKPWWDDMSEAIAELDRLHRDVIHNALWSVKLAEYYWRQPPFRASGPKG